MAEPAGSALTWPDFAIVAASLAFLVVIGGAFSREQRGTADFFLARRRIPWWAACLSFLATEISAVTIISVPATAYSENWEYAQFFVGSSLDKLAVAYLFIPAFYRYDCTTIYEFLLHRFGQASQVTGSVFFFITRLLGSGVRLMAAALAVALLVGWPLWATIALFTAVSIAYIALGGVKAVVWTNVFQACTFLVGGALTVAFLAWRIDGGVGAMLGTAAEAGRLSVINWGPAPGAPDFWHRVLTDPNIFWLAILNGFIGSMAAFGTDHDLMQRLLTVETRGESQRTLALTPIGTLVILRGIMLTAIVLASIDSPLGSLSASFVTDIYRPLLVPGRSEGHYLWVSRVAVVGFGLALAALAWGFSFFDKILWLAFKIAGVTFGSLLGVFLLGLITRLRANHANVAAMVIMGAVNLTLLVLSEMGVIIFAWSWLESWARPAPCCSPPSS